MDEVVVTGTRSEEKVERIPANVTVIDQEDIKNSNAKSRAGPSQVRGRDCGA